MNKQQQLAQKARKEQEHNDMLQQVREVELKARFWKAQWEVRHYTLEAEKIQPAYDEYTEAQRVKNEKAMKEYQEFLDKLSEEQRLKAEQEEIPNTQVAQEQIFQN